MNHDQTKVVRVLAIDPSTRGFGFAVLEGPNRLVDWGTRSARTDPQSKHRECLQKVTELVECYQPDVVVVEKCGVAGSRRSVRVRRLIESIATLAVERKIRARRFSQKQIRAAFAESGAVTKYEIATTISRRFPELAPYLPPPRRAWMSEHHAACVFDAVELGAVVPLSYKRVATKECR